MPMISYAQPKKAGDAYRDTISSISKNIFRLVLSKRDNVPLWGYTFSSLGFQYERPLNNAFTVLFETGLYDDINTFGNLDDPSKSKYQYSFSAFGSLEARYYFNLIHRIKKKKSVHNLSACYISLQEYVQTNPFAFINQKASQAPAGNLQTFLNLGWQKQYQSLYLNVYGGPAVSRRSFGTDYLNGFHAGVSIGYVF